MNIGRQGTNIRFMQGRLLCDLASDGAKVRPLLSLINVSKPILILFIFNRA